MYKKSILLITILLLIVMPVMAEEQQIEEQQTEQPRIAAVVNRDQISVRELDQFAQTQQVIMQLYQTNQEFAQVILGTEAGENVIKEYQKQKLEQLITKKLLESEAQKKGFDLSQEEKNEVINEQLDEIKEQNQLTDEQLADALKQQGKSMEEYKETIIDNYLLGKLQEEVLGEISVTDKEVRDYYENNPSQYEHKAQVKASHILVDSEEKAEEVLNKLNDGADFAEMAKEYSTGPTKDNGGSLGFFGKGQMIPEFEEVAFNLEVGEISEPVKIEDNYHIVKVDDKKEAGISEFEEVKEEIKDSLLNSKKQKRWNDYVGSLREKATIEKNL